MPSSGTYPVLFPVCLFFLAWHHEEVELLAMALLTELQEASLNEEVGGWQCLSYVYVVPV